MLFLIKFYAFLVLFFISTYIPYANANYDKFKFYFRDHYVIDLNTSNPFQDIDFKTNVGGVEYPVGYGNGIAFGILSQHYKPHRIRIEGEVRLSTTSPSYSKLSQAEKQQLVKDLSIFEEEEFKTLLEVTNVLKMRRAGILFNTYYDYSINDNWSVYIGAGAGIGVTNYRGFRRCNSDPMLLEARQILKMVYDIGECWMHSKLLQYMVGVEYNFTNRIKLHLGYYYFQTGSNYQHRSVYYDHDILLKRKINEITLHNFADKSFIVASHGIGVGMSFYF